MHRQLTYLPLIIIWFGIDETLKVLLIFLSCLAPLALASCAGAKAAAQEQTHAAASMGATRWQILVPARVKLPVASIMQPLAEYVRGAKPLRRPGRVPGCV